MRWTEARWRRLALLAGILLVGVIASSLHWMQEKRLAVFGTELSFSVPISDHKGKDYVALSDLLEKLGSVQLSEDGRKLKMRFDALEAEFQAGESTVRVNGNEVKIAGKVLVDSGRPLVPLEAIHRLLPHFLNTAVTYRGESRRLFLGDSGIRFALELTKRYGTQLVVSFSTAVSPQINSEPGKLKMVFARDALLMGTQRWQFDDNVITAAEYQDGAEPVLTISSTEPLLANFTDAGKTIVVTPAPVLAAEQPASTTPELPATPTPRAEPEATLSQPAVTSPMLPTQERYLIVIDASHGGRERGAALSDALAEKDVTLTLARGLRKQLADRGMSSLMVRDADNTLTPDQRAVLANTSQAAVYVAIHAGGLERGVRVYTSMLSAEDAARGPVIPWEKVQAGFARSSRLVGASILDELGKKHVRVPPALLPAPVRPLNNVAAAAVAIEVGPLSDEVATVGNPEYQEVVTNALASALAAVRPKIERAR
ncbi:MAG: N-acetylmuramoyl-L-alanine amidase [Acidobacteriales bacterium]|nr:N-acetylmuramoyl-L-alanine amidase [Terriglobales bacterium]